jgi:heat shock protein HtpX
VYNIPFVAIGVTLWFLIAFASHSKLIKMATKAKPLARKENMRIYNLTENLCISVGMKMPKLFVIDSDALNAFASGINEKTYAVTLTSGIIEQLDDKELEGVIAHELTHIRNKDVRLLIISIIFVGIFAFLVQILFRSVLYGSGRRRNSKVDGRAMLIALAIAVVVYILSIMFKFALSRKREFMADAGAVELTKNPTAMASALRKISGNHDLATRSGDIKQLFIENSSPKKKGFMSSLSGLFATHPPIEKRIAFLEQM